MVVVLKLEWLHWQVFKVFKMIGNFKHHEQTCRIEVVALLGWSPTEFHCIGKMFSQMLILKIFHSQ